MPHITAPAAAALLLALAGCAQMQAVAEGGPGATADACGAAELQTLVGSSVGTLDPTTLPDPNRVIFPGQAVTMDFVEERVNVEIGPDDRVTRVYCG